MSPRVSHFRRNGRVLMPTLIYQLAVGAVLALVALFLSREVALAVLLGAWICAVAQFVFAKVALRPAPGASSGAMLTALYAGAIGKFFIAAVLFACALGLVEFLQTPTSAAAMLLAYAITQLSLIWSPKA